MLHVIINYERRAAQECKSSCTKDKISCQKKIISKQLAVFHAVCYWYMHLKFCENDCCFIEVPRVLFQAPTNTIYKWSEQCAVMSQLSRGHYSSRMESIKFKHHLTAWSSSGSSPTSLRTARSSAASSDRRASQWRQTTTERRSVTSQAKPLLAAAT